MMTLPYVDYAKMAKTAAIMADIARREGNREMMRSWQNYAVQMAQGQAQADELPALEWMLDGCATDAAS